jgi:hypothetical protein
MGLILGMPMVIEASFCINLEVSFSEYPVSMLEVCIVEEYSCQEKWNTELIVCLSIVAEGECHDECKSFQVGSYFCSHPSH